MAKPLWVYFALNGDDEHSVKVNIGGVTTLPELFELAFTKLNLLETPTTKMKPTRVFSHEGIELAKIEGQVYPDDRLYFSTDEDWIPIKPVAATTSPQDGYLYTAGLWTGALVSTGYAAFSHAMKTHAPMKVAQSFTSLEDTINSYSQPIVQSTAPYISSTITWTDQMLNQAIATTAEKTQTFLDSSTGKQLTETTVALKNASTAFVTDYATKAVEAFKAATTGTESTPEEQEATYLNHLQQSLADDWHPSMEPLAKATFHHLGTEVSANGEQSPGNIAQPAQ